MKEAQGIEASETPQMRPTAMTTARIATSLRVRDAALAAFRGRSRDCQLDWAEVTRVPFPRLVSGDLVMLLRTPFQRFDHVLREIGHEAEAPIRPYGLDIWSGPKVYRATWDDDGDLETHRFHGGPWVRTLFGITASAWVGPSEVAMRLATARAAHPSPLREIAPWRDAAVVRRAPDRQLCGGSFGRVPWGAARSTAERRADDEREAPPPVAEFSDRSASSSGCQGPTASDAVLDCVEAGYAREGRGGPIRCAAPGTSRESVPRRSRRPSDDVTELDESDEVRLSFSPTDLVRWPRACVDGSERDPMGRE